jgi:hypothetical protein
MKQRVDGLIQNSDSESGVKQTLNDLVNRSILAAELTSLSRQPGKPLDLPKFEWDRLKAWLKSESLEDQEFRDALALLNAQGSERKKKRRQWLFIGNAQSTRRIALPVGGEAT